MSKKLNALAVGFAKMVTGLRPSYRAGHARLAISNALIQKPEIETKHGKLTLVARQSPELNYANGFFTREPELLEWIDKFEPGSVFWDIGANIGVYSCYAGLAGCTVLAFEPQAENYASFNRNVAANSLADRVSGYCLALSDGCALASLNLSSGVAGTAFNIFGTDHDCSGNQIKVSFRQGMFSISVDQFIETYNPPVPNYLKLDVDSIEIQILQGAQKLLQNPVLKEVMVELETEDSERNQILLNLMDGAGFEPYAEGMAGGAGSRDYFFRRKV